MNIEFSLVCKVIDELDPYYLLQFDIWAPADEYRYEESQIWHYLKGRENVSERKLAAKIRKIFERSFLGSVYVSKEKVREAAREILGISRRHLCPACRNYYFPERDCRKICPECGWLDNGQQAKLRYECGYGETNPLNVREAELKYFLENREEISERVKVRYEDFLKKSVSTRMKTRKKQPMPGTNWFGGLCGTWRRCSMRKRHRRSDSNV